MAIQRASVFRWLLCGTSSLSHEHDWSSGHKFYVSYKMKTPERGGTHTWLGNCDVSVEGGGGRGRPCEGPTAYIVPPVVHEYLNWYCMPVVQATLDLRLVLGCWWCVFQKQLFWDRWSSRTPYFRRKRMSLGGGRRRPWVRLGGVQKRAHRWFFFVV